MGSEWNEYTLGELGKIVTGKTPSSGESNSFGGSMPFITPSDMSGQKYIGNTIRQLTETGSSKLKNLVIPPNSVLVSCIGSDMGKVVINTKNAITNQQINTLIPSENFSSEFIYYCLYTRKSELMMLASGGSAQPILNKSQFSKIKINIPNILTQQRIVNLLYPLDKKIDLNTQMNHTLEAMARALFKSWFVDFDPVKANAEGRRMEGIRPEVQALFPSEFEDSPLGPVPLGWEVKSLDQTANFLNGLALQKFPPTGNGDLPVIKIAQLRKGFTDDSEYAGNHIDKKYIITNGDVLFSWSGSLEVKIWTGGLGALNQHLFKVTSERFPKWFYYLWILNYLPWFREIASSKATTMGHIQRHHLTDAKVLIPNNSLLDSMSNVFNPLFDMLINRQLEIKQLEVIRDTLLPKLLSGELDVSQLSNLVSTD